jgi:hypothetical protein
MTEESLYEKAKHCLHQLKAEALAGWPGLKDVPDAMAMRILAQIANDRSLEAGAIDARLRAERCLHECLERENRELKREKFELALRSMEIDLDKQ